MNLSITRPRPAAAPALAPSPACSRGFDVWRRLRAALAALGTPRAMRQRRDERDALCGLSAHVLRDIGASPAVMADALHCARDEYRVDVDRLRY